MQRTRRFPSPLSGPVAALVLALALVSCGSDLVTTAEDVPDNTTGSTEPESPELSVTSTTETRTTETRTTETRTTGSLTTPTTAASTTESRTAETRTTESQTTETQTTESQTTAKETTTMNGSDGIIEPGLEPFVAVAKADLVARIGVGPDAISVVSARLKQWPDSSAGCPQPGMAYAQVITEGSEIVLAAQGMDYRYTSGGRVTTPTFCPR